jgi:hypothetical protein
MLATPGAGHFDTTDEKNDYIALYLAKAAQYRLPANPPLDGPVKLNPIDPTKQGWLAERWHRDQPPKAAAAPVANTRATRRSHSGSSMANSRRRRRFSRRRIAARRRTCSATSRMARSWSRIPKHTSR